MRKNISRLILLPLLVFVSGVAWAKPQIKLSMTSEKEVTVKQGGKNVVKRMPASDIEPGQILIFTIKYTNAGNEKATNVVINNPIPKETVYEVGSAKGGSEITFSIDNGKDFKRPSLLTYEVTGPDGKKIRKKASPEQYTHVRWLISEVPPGGSGEVSYRARVK